MAIPQNSVYGNPADVISGVADDETACHVSIVLINKAVADNLELAAHSNSIVYSANVRISRQLVPDLDCVRNLWQGRYVFNVLVIAWILDCVAEAAIPAIAIYREDCHCHLSRRL